MKLNAKVGAAIVTVATMIAVPAAALAGPPSNHGNTNHPNADNHPSQSHKCMPHNRAYVEGGTVTALTTDTTGAVTGITIAVTHANHAAKADPTTSLTLTDVKVVRFDDGTSALAVGERVQLIGKIQAIAKKCTPPSGWAPAPTFRMLVVHPAPTPAG